MVRAAGAEVAVYDPRVDPGTSPDAVPGLSRDLEGALAGTDAYLCGGSCRGSSRAGYSSSICLTTVRCSGILSRTMPRIGCLGQLHSQCNLSRTISLWILEQVRKMQLI